MKRLIALLLLSPFAYTDTFFDCEFLSDTKYCEHCGSGTKYTREYYMKEFPSATPPKNVFIQIDTNQRKVTFSPNGEMYSTFLSETNDEIHNGKSNGKNHQMEYIENGNLIEWSFIMMPSSPSFYTWSHLFDRFSGRLIIKYMTIWQKEYKCI